MRYYHTNILVVEYPTKFLRTPITARQKFLVAWTDTIAESNFEVIERGTLIGKNKHGTKHARKTTIRVAHNISLKQFIDQASRHFSEKLNVNPHDLKLSFEKFEPFFNTKEVSA